MSMILPETKSDFTMGATQAIPIVLGYVPVGFAFGVLSSHAGISLGNSLLMSLIVYAGSSQLIGAGLLAAGAPAFTIILTTFIVNLRLMLMSAALAPYLSRWSKKSVAAFTAQLTDETFAVHATQFPLAAPSKWRALGTNIISQIAWVAGTWLGVVTGQLITDVKPFALDYALVALFIALLFLQLRTKPQLMVAIFAGILSVAFHYIGVNRWNVIFATMIGATFGVWIETWIKKRSQLSS